MYILDTVYDEINVLILQCIFNFFFFLCTYTITCRNNASTYFFNDGFRWKIEYRWWIIEVKSKKFSAIFNNIRKNYKKKCDGKYFQQIDFFYIVTQKQISVNTWIYIYISPHVHIFVIYTGLHFPNILAVFELFTENWNFWFF